MLVSPPFVCWFSFFGVSFWGLAVCLHSGSTILCSVNSLWPECWLNAVNLSQPQQTLNDGPFVIKIHPYRDPVVGFCLTDSNAQKQTIHMEIFRSNPPVLSVHSSLEYIPNGNFLLKFASERKTACIGRSQAVKLILHLNASQRAAFIAKSEFPFMQNIGRAFRGSACCCGQQGFLAK